MIDSFTVHSPLLQSRLQAKSSTGQQTSKAPCRYGFSLDNPQISIVSSVSCNLRMQDERGTAWLLIVHPCLLPTALRQKKKRKTPVDTQRVYVFSDNVSNPLNIHTNTSRMYTRRRLFRTVVFFGAPWASAWAPCRRTIFPIS